MSSTVALKTEKGEWAFSKKFAFRFFFIVLTLYICLCNNGVFPYFDKVVYYPMEGLRRFIPWMAANIFHYKYDYTIFTNGSGDTSFDYFTLVFLGILGLLGAILWSAIDFKRKSYNTLYYWLLVFVRAYVALTLFNYGMYKIIKLQFPAPTLYRLTQAYGDSSPMGLAWTFLGYSKGYNIFMGIIEVSALLVLFRKTMIIGAFLALAASAHVMSMNYFYDVPVKILSTTLVVMCLFIIAPYLRKILTFFLTGNAVSMPIIEAPAYKKKWRYYGIYAFKYLFIGATIVLTIADLLQARKTYGEGAAKPPLYGIYKTEKFELNNKELLPLTTDSVRWREFIVQREGAARIKIMTDSLRNAVFKVDTVKKRIAFYFYPDSSKKTALNYSMPDKEHLVLKGMISKDSVNITFKKVDLKQYKLINRQFNWVNEYPYNR